MIVIFIWIEQNGRYAESIDGQNNNVELLPVALQVKSVD